MEIGAGESAAMRSIDIARQWIKSRPLPSRPPPACTSKRRGAPALVPFGEPECPVEPEEISR